MHAIALPAADQAIVERTSRGHEEGPAWKDQSPSKVLSPNIARQEGPEVGPRKKSEKLRDVGVRTFSVPRYIQGVLAFDELRACPFDETRGPMPPIEVRGSSRRRDHRRADRTAVAGRPGHPRGGPRIQCVQDLEQTGLAVANEERTNGYLSRGGRDEAMRIGDVSRRRGFSPNPAHRRWCAAWRQLRMSQRMWGSSHTHEEEEDGEPRGSRPALSCLWTATSDLASVLFAPLATGKSLSCSLRTPTPTPAALAPR
jgi:hypothetical protein